MQSGKHEKADITVEARVIQVRISLEILSLFVPTYLKTHQKLSILFSNLFTIFSPFYVQSEAKKNRQFVNRNWETVARKVEAD